MFTPGLPHRPGLTAPSCGTKCFNSSFISSSQIKDVWDVKPLWLFLLVSLISSVILGGFTSFINTSISSIQVVFVLVLYLSRWMLRLIVLLQNESGIYSV